MEKGLLKNLAIGIWVIDEDGINCTNWSYRHAQISNDVVNAKSAWNDCLVWDFVEHIAERVWADEENTQDLISALAVKRNQLGLKPQPEIDKNTWLRVLEILMNKSEAA